MKPFFFCLFPGSNEESAGVVVDPVTTTRLPVELELRGINGVWTKESISPGTKYGPFTGKWVAKPLDQRFAWEVSTIFGFP